MSKRDRGRRIPPKARGPRGAAPGDFDAIDAAPGAGGDAGSSGVDESPAARAARATRAQNRAAKRAASGVRPKTVRGGPVRGRRSRQTNTPLILLAIAAVAVGAAVFAFGNPFGGPGASPSPTTAASRPVYGDGTCPTSQPAALAASQKKYVSIETELGTIVIEVDGALSPIAAGNFVALADCEYYDGVVFHRTPTLASGAAFVIQGGDPDGTGRGGPGYTIADEPVTASYVRGTVAMARTSAPNSQGSQFFIVLSEEAGQILKATNTYAIFGKVAAGMDVADAIFQASGGVELPADPIAMTRVTVSDTPPPTAAPTAGPTAAPTAASPAAPAATPTTPPTTAP
jgi:cyclophilin family peptidyl-prolyl cis-trans isomerase